MRLGSDAHRSAALRIARNTRLVATGYAWTNSVLPASRQQKYHELSKSELAITWPTFRVRISCTLVGTARNASILPPRKSSIGSTDWLGTQRMSRAGSSQPKLAL